jgi:hypothetical protein
MFKWNRFTLLRKAFICRFDFFYAITYSLICFLIECQTLSEPKILDK